MSICEGSPSTWDRAIAAWNTVRNEMPPKTTPKTKTDRLQCGLIRLFQQEIEFAVHPYLHAPRDWSKLLCFVRKFDVVHTFVAPTPTAFVMFDWLHTTNAVGVGAT